jgi:hypothetical protein
MGRCRNKTALVIFITTLVAFLIVLWACFECRTFCAPTQASNSELKTYSHAPVKLLDENGVKIDPTAKNVKPYSSRKTCGACHDYDTISLGYHFQMGADRISDNFGKPFGKPWVLSDGMVGKQFHMSYLTLARKRNFSEAELGMTTYEFAQTCGVCHPGGGLMEFDRDNKRYDTRLAKDPKLATSFDGDYYKSAWDKSGVIEIDCLMCHLAEYNGKARADQLSRGNFKWAATVGAGLGSVEGSVKNGQTPRLTYQKSLFMPGGFVSLKIGKPLDANCLLCHEEAQVKKRGHVYDGRNPDVHKDAGMKCVTCHTASEDHQIRKGKSKQATVRDDLDDPSFSCEGCHIKSSFAKKPLHKSIPKSHLKSIACATCHVRETNVTAVHTVDTTTGKAVGIPTVKTAKKYGESARWTPAYFRIDDGKIHSGNALLPCWWGNKVGGVVYPLYLSEINKAYERVKDNIKDNDGDGRPEANTESEIKTMIAALRDVLSGGRFIDVSPVYVKGNKIWQMRGNRLISIAYHPQAKPLNWAFSHNVSPAENALGSRGCVDCHGADSKFFNSPVVVDPFDEEGRQVVIPMWRYCGIKKSVIEAKK